MSKRYINPLSITMLYLLLGGLWILYSDRWVAGLTTDFDTLNTLQTYKGWFYILITGLGLYYLMRLHQNFVERSAEKLRFRTQLHNKTLERRIEERTRELNNLVDELESFSYSVSHDLRGPLRAIDGFSQAIMDEYGDNLDHGAKSYLDRVRSASQRVSDIIDDLLRLSKISRVQPEKSTINVSKLAEELIAEFRMQNPDLKFRHKVEQDIEIYSDQGLVKILLSNLISNAAKYSQKVEDPYVEIGRLYREQDKGFYIRDNGIGFEGLHAEKIFKPFQRLSNAVEVQGSGIGLATVDRIVKRLGGVIEVEAEPGRGATFFVSFPVRSAEENVQTTGQTDG